MVLAHATDPSARPLPAIILALNQGVGSLPLPQTFERISVQIDLDAHYVFPADSELDALISKVTDLEDGSLYGRLWRPLVDRLCTQIEGLDSEQRALVLSVLAKETL